ncbi:unnamed protein product [Tilletia laevis]|nr:unnamed protein product [Tilletia laevis]
MLLVQQGERYGPALLLFLRDLLEDLSDGLLIRPQAPIAGGKEERCHQEFSHLVYVRDGKFNSVLRPAALLTLICTDLTAITAPPPQAAQIQQRLPQHAAGSLDTMASEQLVVLTDELYAGVLSSIDACARDTGNPATTVKLSKIVKRALEASRNSTGSKEASLRRGKIRAFGDEHFEQDIGLGTLACQVLVSSSSERRRILPKGSIADGSPSFSLKKSFRLIPVQLRHVCLPLHAAIQAFSVLENMGGFAGRSDLPRLAKSITLGFMELESIYQMDIFTDLLLAFRTMGPLSAFYPNPSWNTTDRTAESAERMGPVMGLSLSGKLCPYIENCSDIRELGRFLSDNFCPRYSLLWFTTRLSVPDILQSCLRTAERLLPASAQQTHPDTTDDLQSFDRAVQVLDEGIAVVMVDEDSTFSPSNMMPPTDQLRHVQHPQVDPKWTSDALHQTLRSFAHSAVRVALPRATRALVTLLVLLLFRSRLHEVTSEHQTDLERLDDSHLLYCCFHKMEGHKKKLGCPTEGWGKTSFPEVEERYSRESLMLLEPTNTCKHFATLLRYYYGLSDAPAGSMAKHISRSASGHQVLLDPRKFVARESHGDTAIILECVVTLSGMGLHRAEAELSAIMLAAWDAQTACHPNELDHGSRRPKSVDHSEEYDCENLGQRVVRRNAISRLIGARVARAEAKAVAQEQAWASARAQEERALRGAVGSRWIAPAQMAPTWRYEPLLDQWVATRSSDGPTGSDGERLSKSKHNRGTPRVSSSDPSVRPITAQDEEGDDAASQSEAESVSSNLRFTGGPSNPYAHAMQAIEGQKKPKRTEPGPDDEDNELDEMDLFNRRTPVAKRRRRPPQRYNPQEEERRSKGKGKDRA